MLELEVDSVSDEVGSEDVCELVSVLEGVVVVSEELWVGVVLL